MFVCFCVDSDIDRVLFDLRSNDTLTTLTDPHAPNPGPSDVDAAYATTYEGMTRRLILTVRSSFDWTTMISLVYMFEQLHPRSSSWTMRRGPTHPIRMPSRRECRGPTCPCRTPPLIKWLAFLRWRPLQGLRGWVLWLKVPGAFDCGCPVRRAYPGSSEWIGCGSDPKVCVCVSIGPSYLLPHVPCPWRSGGGEQGGSNLGGVDVRPAEGGLQHQHGIAYQHPSKYC